MKDAKHTLGPWAIGQKYQSIIAKHKTGHDDDKSIDAYGGHMICESVKMQANAHLIAAAPDLLEALEEVLDGLGFLSGGDHELEGWGIDEVRGAEIRAAIAKAKGKTT